MSHLSFLVYLDFCMHLPAYYLNPFRSIASTCISPHIICIRSALLHPHASSHILFASAPLSCVFSSQWHLLSCIRSTQWHPSWLAASTPLDGIRPAQWHSPGSLASASLSGICFAQWHSSRSMASALLSCIRPAACHPLYLIPFII